MKKVNDHVEFVTAQKLYKLPNIETSNRCSLKCPQCTRVKLQKPRDSKQYKEIKTRISSGFDLPLSDAKKLLDFFEEGIALCGSLSDPVFWPNLFDFLDLSQIYPNKRIEIHTAANQKNIDWYKQAFSKCTNKVTWIFGLDGLPKTSPIYRIGQDSELIFEAMILAKNSGIPVVWQFIVFEHNKHEIEDAQKIAVDNGIDFHLIKSNRIGGNVEVPLEYKPKRNKEII